MSQLQEAPTHPLTHYRHEESENYLARGLECMLLAEEGGYQDTSLLTEACDAFIEAIKFNRQHTEAYVGMAYLLWLLGDEKQALSYLEQGLRTNPSHPDVHVLIKQISGKTVQNTSHAAQNQVNQRVRDMVQELVERLQAEKLAAIQPSVNEHVLERLQDKALEWELAYDEVLTAIDGLEAFHERVMLTCDLGPVQDCILAYHEALQRSEKLLMLDAKILEDTRLASQYLAEIERGDPGMFQAYLEVLLDNCDALADELEVLETEGLNIRTLDSHYQQLVERVEDLQTQVDQLEAREGV